MRLSQKEEQALNRFKEYAIDQMGSEILSIRLFGSKARGTARRNSDVDVLVVTQHDDWKLKDKIGAIATDILLDSGVYLSLKVFGKAFHNRLLKVGSPFIRNVQREGILL